MMEKKYQCKVDPNIECLAHIVEQNYQDRFSVWYGSLELSTLVESLTLKNKDRLIVRLDDGRIGSATAVGSDSTFGNEVTADPLSKEIYLLYIVGTSILSVPTT